MEALIGRDRFQEAWRKVEKWSDISVLTKRKCDVHVYEE